MSMDHLSESEHTIIQRTQQWVNNVVIGLNLCPFAKAVVNKQQVRYVVCPHTDPEQVLQTLQAELQLLAQTDPHQLDTTLLIAPHLLPDFLAFNEFLFDCDAVLLSSGLEGVLQIADFHPLYQFAGTQADDISNCTNRSPYPTLHLLREDSVDKAVAAYPDASLIYERNMQVLEELGKEAWERLNASKRASDGTG